MKKFFAILLILILFSINTINIKAASTAVMPFDNAIALYDFSNGLQNGLTYDMSKYSNYATWQEAEEAFYRDILNYLAQVNWGGEYNADQLYNSYYTLDYGMTNSIANDFTKRYNDYVLDPTNGFAIPLGKDVTASWNRFNDYYVKKYLDAVNADLDNHPTYADPDYASYIDLINGSGFFFRNWSYNNLYPSYTNINLSLVPAYNYSWLVFPESGISQSAINNNILGNDLNRQWSSNTCNKTSAYITTLENGQFYYRYTGVCPANFTYFGNTYNSALYRVVGGSDYVQANFTNIGTYTYQSSYFNTLESCFSDLSKHAKNVDIYVDGVLWSYTGVIENPFISAPDVIFGENDEMLDNDIPIPNTDGYFDYIALQNLIHEAIENADIIGWDTLIENGIVIDGEGDALQESDFTKDSIRDIDDDETDDLPLENIIPPPPPPPPLFQDWKFTEINPEEDPRPRAISVLARIINVTNKSLPSDVMAMFWGICITLLILGLIKIMHK